ncbi:hypothetical protein [Cerasicoccus arenae]|uniref:Uncharacterized protein n=1 Tax=Cerasicoccus arenae TaxID=424488 RepID=A0A8J3GDD3_9BACT|nr:hypothetical protein [Cerasicoccus arenae]MBK1857617.1 hypothetical protein [Cerasicoccus arenae]GHC05547.1 hypothetical protein GCM10007047_23090 [Cerasicoccus arenae]
MEKLAMLLQAKKANPELAHDVVSAASDWLKTQLQTAQVEFHFADCEKDYCGFATFQINSIYRGSALTLYLKIAEVRATPYVFADIRVRNGVQHVMFPFFGELGSDEGKEILLNYIADFLLSVE